MISRLCLCAFALALWPQISAAQESEGYRIEARVEPILGPDTAAVDDLARRTGARDELIYAEKISGDLTSGKELDALRKDKPREFGGPSFGGGFGVWIVLALVLGALLVWLRYGGAGNLLRARPKADRAPPPQEAPDAWAIRPEDRAMGPEALITRLMALPDRGQAAAELLRHSLLAAADETRVRLARADTERQAFDRLPHNWRQHNGLKNLLKIAELAHYGGRPVSDDSIAQLAQIARAILIPGRGEGRPHA
jgi:hypothetical protein